MEMKIWSDLHIEGKWFNYEYQPEDKDLILILAGDIGTIRVGLEAFLIHHCDNFKHVIYVMGNHESYSNNIDSVREQIRDLEKTLDNLYFLDNDSVILEGVRFLGTPLYTQLTPRNQEIVKNGINDYRVTMINGDNGERRLTPADHNYLYEQAVLWLRYKLDQKFDGKTVVITHWAFTHKLIDSQYFGSPFNPYFCNDLEHLCHSYKISDWIYGHGHDRFVIDYGDSRFNGTRVICNCRGYHYESDSFDPNLIWEV